jgi:NhaC family Na+:H+ antiporter
MAEPRPMSLGYALVPVGVLMVLLALNVVAFGDSASYGPNQVAMLVAAFLAAGMGIARGVVWHTIAESIGKTIGSTSEALLILLLIGALSGTWLIAGIIPAFIDLGLQALNAEVFLAAACVICSALSLATGTSWGTVGTIGVALAGIGTALGLHPGWVAGAIISGAYFGDKLSPMSDTTNLAPAVSGTDLFTHVRYMLYTTIPSLAIALIVFLVAGFGGGAAAENLPADSLALADAFGTAVRGHFHIHPGLFIAPVAVIVLIVKKMPAAPALLIGVLLGAVTAVVFQPEVVREIAGPDAGSYVAASYRAALAAMTGDVAVVMGQGPIGLIFTMLLKHKGIRTLATDTMAERRALSEKFCAERCLNPRTADVAAACAAEPPLCPPPAAATASWRLAATCFLTSSSTSSTRLKSLLGASCSPRGARMPGQEESGEEGQT